MEETIIEQCIRQRMPFPDAIQNAPSLQFGLELFYEAFFNLSTCRQVGQDGIQGPIPWISMNDYCLRLQLSDEQSDDMFHHMKCMDSAYLNHCASKRTR